MIYILICYFLLTIKIINSIEIVRGSKILLSSNTNFSIPKNKCLEILIPNNFKKIKMYLKSNEINDLLLTDKKINSCQNNDLIGDCCGNNSTFCIKETFPSYNYYHLYNCLESSYLYVCGNNNKNISSSIKIILYVIKDEGCQFDEDNNDEAICAKIGLSECKKQTNSRKKCQYIECFSEKNEKLIDLCLPSYLSDEEINEKCSNHIDYGENGKFQKLNFNDK